MAYDYQSERPQLFTEAGQVMLLAVRDKIQALTTSAGACTIEKAISGLSGETWTMLACVDRLVELGEIRVIKNPHGMTQHNVIIRMGAAQ